MVKHETARAISRAMSVSLFERCGYDAKYMAQRNLSGKTHYADDDTLKFFHARIISARVLHEGLLFGIVESAANDPDNRSRGFRFAVFDLFGTVLNDRDHGDAMYNKSDKAAAAMAEWLKSFDVLAHYKRAMLERADRLRREAESQRLLLEAILEAACLLEGEPSEIKVDEEWSGSPDPEDPDNFWICDKTGKRIPG